MSQSSLFDVVAFDPFAFRQDGLASAEVDVGARCAGVEGALWVCRCRLKLKVWWVRAERGLFVGTDRQASAILRSGAGPGLGFGSIMT